MVPAEATRVRGPVPIGSVSRHAAIGDERSDQPEHALRGLDAELAAQQKAVPLKLAYRLDMISLGEVHLGHYPVSALAQWFEIDGGQGRLKRFGVPAVLAQHGRRDFQRVQA